MNNYSEGGLMIELKNRIKQIKEYQAKNSEEKRKRTMQTNFYSYHVTSKYHRLVGEADAYAKKLVALTQ